MLPLPFADPCYCAQEQANESTNVVSDEALEGRIALFQLDDWEAIARKFPKMTAVQCQLVWMNNLSPRVNKHSWSGLPLPHSWYAS